MTDQNEKWSKKELEKEINDRIHYMYLQTDGTFDFPNSAEGDLIKLVNKYMKKPNELSSAAGSQRPECLQCNHLPVCKDELKQNLEGHCPYFENDYKNK